MMASNHLQKARDLLARRKKQGKVEEDAFNPHKNGHRSAPDALKTCGEMRRNTISSGEDAFLAANDALSETFDLIYRDEDTERVLEWLKGLADVSVDSETYGEAKTRDERKKLALSFARGKIRLIQLADEEGNAYFLDARFLSRQAVALVLEALKGKALYLHNAIFDLPRFKKHFGVDLFEEDIRDTMILSRVARAGEWVFDETKKNKMRPFAHNIRDALLQEGVAVISKETDHRWEEPLDESRLSYAKEDVQHLISLERSLMAIVRERGLERGLALFKRVFPTYMRMQHRGVPFDLRMFQELTRRYAEKASAAQAKLEEHKPDHPDGEEWSWGNKQKFNPEKAKERFENNEQRTPLCPGRNGALRALSGVGITIGNLKKPTRIEYLRKHPEGARLLEALHQLYIYSDLLSDCESWVKYSYEDGRLYPNVNPFSQVTGRSAFSAPALQNIPKEPDEEGELSLRDCIRAVEDYRLVKADYAAQELRILAHVTGDKALIEAFAKGDPHIVVAEKIAGRTLQKDTEEYKSYRKLGKRANYGFSYGAGAARYAKTVFEDTSEPISEEQAKDEQKAFRQAWEGVYEWQQDYGARDGSAGEDWYTLSPLGRRRYVDQKKDRRSDRSVPSYCDRLNGPIQQAGVDMLYRALEYLIEDQEKGFRKDARIIITTHDEIVLEAPKETAKDALAWLEEAMRKAAGDFLSPELSGEDCVEGEIRPSWGGN